MSGRIEFGIDYLYLARELQSRASDAADLCPISDAAARLFLLLWGLSVDEMDEANNVFWERVNSATLDEFHLAYQRIVDHVKKDRAAQERLVVQFAALGAMDFNVTEDEGFFMRWFMESFDLRPSEFMALCQRGWDLAIAFDYFGKAYLEFKRW